MERERECVGERVGGRERVGEREGEREGGRGIEYYLLLFVKIPHVLTLD